MVTRISDKDITKGNKPYVYEGSQEDAIMAADAAIRVKGLNVTLVGLQTGGDGLLPDDSKFNERPELSDIESVTQTVYYDSKKKKKFVKVVVRIRNSSGKTLLGIDARKTIPVVAGGQ